MIRNRFIAKKLCWNENGFFLDSLVNCETGNEYCRIRGCEFSFSVDGINIESYSEPQIQEVDGNMESRNNVPRFNGSEIRKIDETTEEIVLSFIIEEYGVAVKAVYRIFSEIPGIVKYLEIQALNHDISIDKLVFDAFNFYPGRFSDCSFYSASDDVPLPLLFAVEGSTDLIRCHNPVLREGFLCGSSVPGPLRRFFGYAHWNSMKISYSMGSCPFRKHLRKDDVFRTDKSFLLLYRGDRNAGESAFRALLRTAFPPPSKPGVMYCTWLPFLKGIHEKMVLELAERAAGMGFRYFVLDDGWFTNERRRVDAEKFPHGLEFLSEKIRGLGLRFGLWYNIGTSYGNADTPDAFVCRLPDGKLKMLGENKVLCFASEHRENILKELIALSERYHAAYFKLDFSSILSPYAILPYGCFCKNHRFHRGYEDSVIEMYRGFLYLRDELKKKFPELLIDFSFEAFGTDRPNIAALEYSDLHHVSNLSGLVPELQDIVKIRKQFYRWFGKLPPERILGGLLVLRNGLSAEYLLTSFSSAPLVSGDLRELSEEERERNRIFTKAFNSMTEKEALTELDVVADREDFDAFIRKGKSGHGFLCVFNRKQEEVVPDIPTPFPCINVETKSSKQWVSAKGCAMFTF